MSDSAEVTGLDHAEAMALAFRYADLINQSKYDDMGEVFAADAEWQLQGLQPIVGLTEIIAKMHEIRSEKIHFQVLQGGEVLLDGDGGAGRWYVAEYGVLDEEHDYHLIAVYDDLLVRTRDGWRFRRREFRLLHRAKHPRAGKFYPVPPRPTAR